MATDNSDCFVDGAVHSRTLLFNGTNYSLWKGRIKEFLMEIDFEIWFVVKLGYKGQIRDTDQITDIDQLKDIPKEEKIAMSMDAKAKNILDMLQITYEGTKQVRQERVAILIHQYENIGQMYTCFMDLINPLFSLEKNVSEEKQVRKILRSLPSHWTPKVTAIQEAKDLSTKTIGSLTSREITLFNKEGIPDSKESKNISFNTRFDTEKETRDEQDDICCYKCEEIGHIKFEYPKLKKNQKSKGKAMASTWDDSDDEFQNEEEYLIAGEEEKISIFEKRNKVLKEKLADMLDFAEDLKKENPLLKEENSSLKDKVSENEKQNALLQKENFSLIEKFSENEKENFSLKEENESLKKQIFESEKDLKLNSSCAGNYAGCSSGTSYFYLEKSSKKLLGHAARHFNQNTSMKENLWLYRRNTSKYAASRKYSSFVDRKNAKKFCFICDNEGHLN
ncbi:RNA uridylyltransferase [Handroanthus impetiginosus]|uniref:RNA uridylyltransferase n=1 Tax=Handroanthus impetiginosus TaxID=429701 RepID=A0A2G9FXL3_9LAMI|nr:RNA uridylyltransferase [Handroanthus impetiginosus]